MKPLFHDQRHRCKSPTRAKARLLAPPTTKHYIGCAAFAAVRNFLGLTQSRMHKWPSHRAKRFAQTFFA
jgi:hypothetical protein